jgi:hypothetical protein
VRQDEAGEEAGRPGGVPRMDAAGSDGDALEGAGAPARDVEEEVFGTALCVSARVSVPVCFSSTPRFCRWRSNKGFGRPTTETSVYI